MQVRVGVGVLIIKDNQVLLGKRINSHGANCWGPPGGHLEFGETPEECAIREVKEETNLEIDNIKPGPWSNEIFKDQNKHYISLFIIAQYKQGILELREPEKCQEWRWFKYEKLPESLFLPIENIINKYGNLKNLLVEYL